MNPISENIQHELKLYVERVVRPVVAHMDTKLQMREELYQHVQDVYQQERALADDPQEALKRALTRTGNPTTLTTELQATVSSVSRLGGRYAEYLKKWFGRRDGEPILRTALRTAGYTFVGNCCFVAVALIGNLADIVSWTARGEILVRFCAAYVLLFTINMFVFVLLGTRFRDQLEAGFTTVGHYLSGAALVLAGSIFVLATGWGLTFLMTGDAATAWSELSTPTWWRLAALTLPGFLLGSYASLLEHRRHGPWLSLELDT